MLLINLDYQTRIPIYAQIVNQIERYVALGILSPKDQIPSIRELAATLGVNPNTVKKAYDFLEQKKVIMTISTKGTFISEETEDIILKKRESLLEEIHEKVKEYQRLGGKVEDIKKMLSK